MTGLRDGLVPSTLCPGWGRVFLPAFLAMSCRGHLNEYAAESSSKKLTEPLEAEAIVSSNP